MNKFFEAVAIVAILSGLTILAGALFTLGCSAACQWLEWSPVNLTIQNHIHNYSSTEETEL
jgi:hypothetical protein